MHDEADLFRELVEQVREYAIFRIDPEGRVVTWNEGVRTVLGYDRPEFLGLDTARLFTPEDRAAGVVERELSEARRTGSANDDRWMLRKDGSRIWVAGRTSPITDAAGALVGYTKVMRDQTELRQATDKLLAAEAGLEAERARFAAVLDQLPAGVILAEAPSGRILAGNRHAEHIWRHDLVHAERVDAYRAYRGYHPDGRAYQPDEWPLARAIARGEVVEGEEIRFQRGDGTWGWMSASAAPIRSQTGQVVAGVVTFSDVTERKRTEDALRESEQRLRATYDTAAIGIREATPDGRIVRVNPKYCEISGYSEAELIGRPLQDLVHPDDAAVEREESRRLFAGEVDSYTIEKRYLRKDGRVVWGRLTESLLRDADGTPRAAIGVVEDVTQRKQTDERLAQAQRMEAVGRLAGGVAHDLNNMLLAIIGHTEFVARTLEAGDPRREDLAQVGQAAQRSATLTRQLLTFARRDFIPPRLVDLNGVVRATERMLRSTLGENVELVTRLFPDLGSVVADPGRLEQVLVNLALNARDAMPGGGRVTIETSRVVLDAAYADRHPGTEVRPGPYVRLSVGDTGHGMDSAIQARIFEPFFTTKPVGQGTGLGLSMVYGAMKQSSGFVWVYSEPGEGSVFTLYFPMVERAPPEADPAPAAPVPRGRETVLVVEDEAVVRALARRALAEYGYAPLEAASATEALALVERHQGGIDLVVSDVVMPGMSGGELGEELRRRLPATPVLYVSGFPGAHVVGRGLIAPGRPFLQKPFTPDEFARAVRRALDDARAAPGTGGGEPGLAG